MTQQKKQTDKWVQIIFDVQNSYGRGNRLNFIDGFGFRFWLLSWTLDTVEFSFSRGGKEVKPG